MDDVLDRGDHGVGALLRIPVWLFDLECKDSKVFSDDQLETIREVARAASADHDLRQRLEDRDDEDQSLRPAIAVRKYVSRRDQEARRAVGGYLALARNPGWNEMERTEGLGRSLEIAGELRDDELTDEVASNMLEAAKHEISSDEWRPGIPLRLLQPLVRLPNERQPDGLRDQLDAVEKRYGADPYIAQAAGESIAQLSTPDQRR